MNILVKATGIAAVSTCLYLLSLKPARTKREGFEPFERTLIAHRGLHDNKGDAPENSLPAFRKAVERGFGIEMDVQLTKDGELVVFHDEDLKRMCGADVKVQDLDYDDLKKYKLANSDEHIPLFTEVFDIFRDKAPAVIELKPHGNYIGTAKKLMEYMDGYEGAYLVQSFHPRLVRWFMKNRPDVLRGQLSTVFGRKSTTPWIARVIATNLMTNFLTRPDFISYNVKYKNQFSYRLMRKLYDVENAGWTIKSEEELKSAEDTFNIFIFDSFDPGETRLK